MSARTEHLTNDEYHATPAVGSSMISTYWDDGPTVYNHRYLLRSLPADNGDHFRLGTAVHSLVEGKPAWVEIPADVLTKNGQRRGKAWEQFAAEHNGQLLLNHTEAAEAQAIVNGIFANEHARKLLGASGELSEHSIFWQDERLAPELKCRPDTLLPGIVLDLKTTKLRRPDKRRFGRVAHDYGYHRQARHYQDGVQLFTGDKNWESLCIVVSKVPPYLCFVHRWPEDALLLGEQQNDRALRLLGHHYESGEWSDEEAQQIADIELPPWSWKE